MRPESEELLRRELAPGERLLWSGGPCRHSHWEDYEPWFALLVMTIFGKVVVDGVRASPKLELPAVDWLVPVCLGVAGAAVPAAVLVLFGRPAERSRWEPHLRLVIGLTLGWIGAMVLLAFVWKAARDVPRYPTLYGLFIGLFSTGLAALVEVGHWAEGVTAYGPTDSDAVVLRRGPFGGRMQRLPLDAMRLVELGVRPDGWGTIRFPDFARPCDKHERCCEGFYDINQARRVYDLVETGRAAAQRRPSAIGFDGEDDKDAVWRVSG